MATPAEASATAPSLPKYIVLTSAASGSAENCTNAGNAMTKNSLSSPLRIFSPVSCFTSPAAASEMSAAETPGTTAAAAPSPPLL